MGRAIGEAFERCQREKRPAFIPYLTAGDPHPERTPELLAALARGGADIIELGVPFSDPIADGPVNQRAASRALAAGMDLEGVLEIVARSREKLDVPIVLFTYFNPIHAHGVERFVPRAASSGVDGVLCLDLPPEEAAGRWLEPCRAEGLDTVFLLSPTSTRERVRLADEATTGFLYYVSRTGVTGVRDELDPSLLRSVRRLRRKVHWPLAVGFGLSTSEQVEQVGRVADGVVVGSALVRIVEEHGADEDLPRRLEAAVRSLTGREV